MHRNQQKNPELLDTIATKTLFFPWINNSFSTIWYICFWIRSQVLLVHPLKRFITSSEFHHLLIKQFALQFCSCHTKLQNNITVTVFGKHLLIRLYHWARFVNLFSTKQCRNCALIFKVLSRVTKVLRYSLKLSKQGQS